MNNEIVEHRILEIMRRVADQHDVAMRVTVAEPDESSDALHTTNDYSRHPRVKNRKIVSFVVTMASWPVVMFTLLTPEPSILAVSVAGFQFILAFAVMVFTHTRPLITHAELMEKIGTALRAEGFEVTPQEDRTSIRWTADHEEQQ
jgi:hypothetical protein